MKILSKPVQGHSYFQRDLAKLACLAAALIGMGALFLFTPGLSTPTLLSGALALLFSPAVSAIERRGYSRGWAILVLFGAAGLALTIGFSALYRLGSLQWESWRDQAPGYFAGLVQRLRDAESSWQLRFPILHQVKIVDRIIQWGQGTGQWFMVHGAALMGDALSCAFVAPILTFFLLSDGRNIQKRLYQLVPNRYFETTYLIAHEIGSALSGYLRAKMIEALVVGLMVTAGLTIVGAPYAIVLGIVAGLTNVVPYVGPIIGIVPGAAIAALDPSSSHLLWPVLIVYGVANLIDMVVIFPGVVAKLIDLHPLWLIAAVSLGQQYYGLVGMLISIPIASAIKVVLSQVYLTVYEKAEAR